jgi:2-C-methyl-D-erythritol 4-phosphate cytidylyltransferase/2-C-methyl-D-erythritol 4-phosphate cytidylyltransferase/2-C-methyl-D-erythritol 2,4-cyclodiphosphate synthase
MDAASSTAAVICAAGSSSRMGGIKKEYKKLNEGAQSLTVLGSVVRAFASVPSVQIIVIAVPENGEEDARSSLPREFLTALSPKIFFVKGGETRRISVFNALSFLASLSPCYVLIHDGARPWVSPSLIEKIIAAVKKHGAVIPLLPLTDTPKECACSFVEMEPEGKEAVFIKNHLKRASTGIAQTPQAFKFPEILEAHEKAAGVEDEEFTDDAEIWGRFFGPVAVVLGDPQNKKITFPEDIK